MNVIYLKLFLYLLVVVEPQPAKQHVMKCAIKFESHRTLRLCYFH